MTEHSTPTRSEVCYLHDVLLDGYRGVVLSDEAAIGRYPIESLPHCRHVSRVAFRSQHDRPADIFEIEIPAAIKANPKVVKDLNAVIHFNLTGQNGGVWTLDATVIARRCQSRSHSASRISP